MKQELFGEKEWKRICDSGIVNIGNNYRLSKAINRAVQGKEIKIGFIGGSITAGSLASMPETCYAYLVYSWWNEMFPRADIGYINAGIGATTSQYGVARVSKDLLSYEPDVVFVEFSVNDRDEEKFMETYEGLIRRILTHPKEPAVVIINNVCYDSGDNAQSIHNRVGTYYDLPIDEQANFYESCFRVFHDKAWFAGHFWWDWSIEIYDSRDEAVKDTGFNIHLKKAEDVVKRWYKE
ncbi:MAG TPA: GDSL-type esterase/lipase family protein [Mobilitalea sp.]|nr:GDSL-type esterase/lipase family protein [Mobilitalea sp.]